MAGQLTARFVATAAPGVYHDGGGLYLAVTPAGARSWTYRFSWRGRRPEMGLGSFPDVSLAEARDLRDEARRILRSGRNPIEERRTTKAAATARPTFGIVADMLLESKAKELRSERSFDQWKASLTEGVAALRERPVDEIDTEAILEVLKPLWIERPNAGDRLRGRIEAVLDAAKAKGHRSGENPARWRGHLSHLLPRRQKLAHGHHAAMNYHDAPAFMDRLRQDRSIGARALEFCILTATRTGEVLGARWEEIDLTSRVWTLPAARMKAAREHRVPIAEQAVKIIESLAPFRTCDFLFPSPRGPHPLSHVVMQKALARLGVADATTHGFRSTFRDWAGNETHAPREVAEAALAHVIGNAAEQAYRRQDALEKRRALMQAWADFLDQREAENVIQMRR